MRSLLLQASRFHMTKVAPFPTHCQIAYDSGKGMSDLKRNRGIGDDAERYDIPSTLWCRAHAKRRQHPIMPYLSEDGPILDTSSDCKLLN